VTARPGYCAATEYPDSAGSGRPAGSEATGRPAGAGLDVLTPRGLHVLVAPRRLDVLAAGAHLRAVGPQGRLGGLDLRALLRGRRRRRTEHHETGQRHDRGYELPHGVPPLAVICAVVYWKEQATCRCDKGTLERANACGWR